MKNISFNDFECKSVEKLCPNFTLDFKIDKVDGFLNIIYTSICVKNKQGDTLKNINAINFNPRKGGWFKSDVQYIVSLINKTIDFTSYDFGTLSEEIILDSFTNINNNEGEEK